MLNQDFNDWTQAARDQNTGLKYPVRLHVSNTLPLSDAHVDQVNAEDLSSTDLTLKGTVKNTSATAQTGDVDATITDPSGGNPITVHQTVSLAAGESKVVTFDPVHIANPKLWWPYQMGDQPLYKFTMKTSQGGTTSDTSSRTFGIRTIKTWLSAKGTKAYNGSRWFSINGKPFVFRGGGMMDSDMFLRYSKTRLDHEVSLIKAMGLNGLRLEGDDQPDSFYDEMDKQGLLVYGGFLCCNYWESPTSWTAKDLDVNYNTALSARPPAAQPPERDLLQLERRDARRGAGGRRHQRHEGRRLRHPDHGVGGVQVDHHARPVGHEGRPVQLVPAELRLQPQLLRQHGREPVHQRRVRQPRRRLGLRDRGQPRLDDPDAGLAEPLHAAGGAAADGHVAEPAPVQLRPRRPGQRHELPSFQHIGVQATAICRRYGTWTAAPVTCPTNPPGATGLYANSPNITDFVKKGIALNYESVRAQFESYIDHSTRTDSPSTGIVYWMMNKPMPSLLWNLYNHDYDQAGPYFGAKKANTPLHVYYSYAAPENDPGNRMVNVANLTGSTQAGLTVSARTYDMTGKVIDSKDAWNISLPSQGVMNQLFQVPNPTLPDVNGVPQRTYFLELQLKRGTKVIDRNVYWLSTVNDVPTYTGNAYPNLTTYGDLRNLQTPAQDPINGLLAKTTLAACATTHAQSGLPDGQDTATDVRLTNQSSTVAFLARVDVRKGSGTTPAAGDNQLRPANYSDNYVTLWPGQSQTITETYKASDLGGSGSVVSVTGHNVDTTYIASNGGCSAQSGVEDLGHADGDVPLGGATPGQANTPEALAAAKAAVQVGKVTAVDGPPVGGTVPATLSLTLGAPATFGAFTPGVAKDYTASTTANVISTAGDATLTVPDPGHLMNGSFSLPEPLLVAFSKATWTAPVSNDPVTIAFKQHINANDALRTGAYSKTLTFTLSTTTP